jgi:hypothetical protein
MPENGQSEKKRRFIPFQNGLNSNQHIQNVNEHKATSVLKDSDLTETMSTIHEKYVVFPADKTRNNIVL